jgi:hypothetical protein
VALGLLGDAMNHGPSEPVFSLIAEARDTIESALPDEPPAPLDLEKVYVAEVCFNFEGGCETVGVYRGREKAESDKADHMRFGGDDYKVTEFTLDAGPQANRPCSGDGK